MAFNNFPYTSFQDLNLDWVLQKLKQAVATATQAASTVSQYDSRLLQVENNDSAQNTRISALETSDAQQDTDIYNASEAALTAQRDAATAIQTANLIAENQAFSCEINATQSPFTSSKNYTALYNILYTQKKPVNFILTDASNVKYETALAYVGSDKIRAIFIMDRANSSQSYGVIYADILSNNTVELRTDSITTGGGGTAADAVLYVAQQLTEAEKAQARTNIGAGTGTSIVRVNASDGTITITDPNLATGNPITYQYRTIFPIVAVYSNGEYTFDRNQADILSAIQNGMLPVVRYHTTTGQSDYHVYYEWVLDYYTYDGEEVYIYFSRVDQNGNSAQLRWYGSTGKATEVSRPTLPPATSADDGKIPMVNSFGSYQLVTPSASSGTPRITMANTDTTPSLDANKFYVFPEMASLSVSLNSPASNAIVNEFHFRFTSGSTATQFDLPATVEIPDDFDVAADTVYEISIIDNYMVYSSWAVSA